MLKSERSLAVFECVARFRRRRRQVGAPEPFHNVQPTGKPRAQTLAESQAQLLGDTLEAGPKAALFAPGGAPGLIAAVPEGVDELMPPAEQLQPQTPVGGGGGGGGGEEDSGTRSLWATPVCSVTAGRAFPGCCAVRLRRLLTCP